MLTVWVAAIALALPLLLWLTNPTYTADEPQPVQHYVPILGWVWDFTVDKRKFFRWAAEKNNYQPFSILLGGRKHHIFHNLTDITAIYRHAKTLDMRNFVRMLYTNMFGMTKDEAEIMDQTRDKRHADTNLYLLKAENYTDQTINYFQELDAGVKTFDKKFDESDVVVEETIDFVRRIQGTASTISYFGKRIFEESPDILKDLTYFSANGFWPLFLGFPRFLIPETYRVRDKVQAAVDKIIYEHPEELGPFLRSSVELGDQTGIPKSAVSKNALSFLFGVNANSIPTATVCLVRLLHHPDFLAECLAEIKSTNLLSLPPSEYPTIIPAKLPHLRALLFETFRWHGTSVTIREVHADTTIVSDSTWKLKKGSIVTMPSSLTHRSPQLFDKPEEFHIKRFLPVELGGEGADPKKGVRPFGGGASYCPGRVFAEKQVMGFLAVVIGRYEIRIVEGEEVVHPTLDFENVVKQKPVKLEFKRREMLV